jgi:hypothetical protein
MSNIHKEGHCSFTRPLKTEAKLRTVAQDLPNGFTANMMIMMTTMTMIYNDILFS